MRVRGSGAFIALLCAAVLISFPGKSTGIVVYLDEEGKITGTAPPGVQPIDGSELWWWLNQEEKPIETVDRGGARVTAAWGLTGAAGAATAVTGTGSTITLVNVDGPGEGLNDGTPVAPVGGNGGTTLGEQRMTALVRATEIWAGELSSAVPIAIDVSFDPLECSGEGAVGGAATPVSFHRDFGGAVIPGTWYVQALANAITGTDQYPGVSDVRMKFNTSLDEGCLPGISWYYGLDGNCPGNQLDFVTIALHEICHGLGFISAVAQDGTKYFGYDDVFSFYLRDVSARKNWPAMTNAERASSAIDTGDLVWSGPGVTSAGMLLTAGRHPISGQVMMFAPNPYQPGSSVSHFTDTCFPDELMEPSYTEVIHDPDLCVELMMEIGWGATTGPAASSVEGWQRFD